MAWLIKLVYLLTFPLIVFFIIKFSRERPFIPIEEAYGVVYVALLQLGNTHDPQKISTRIIFLL